MKYTADTVIPCKKRTSRASEALLWICAHFVNVAYSVLAATHSMYFATHLSQNPKQRPLLLLALLLLGDPSELTLQTLLALPL